MARVRAASMSANTTSKSGCPAGGDEDGAARLKGLFFFGVLLMRRSIPRPQSSRWSRGLHRPAILSRQVGIVSVHRTQRGAGGFTRFSGGRLRQGGASSLNVREKPDCIPAKVNRNARVFASVSQEGT